MLRTEDWMSHVSLRTERDLWFWASTEPLQYENFLRMYFLWRRPLICSCHLCQGDRRIYLSSRQNLSSSPPIEKWINNSHQIEAHTNSKWFSYQRWCTTSLFLSCFRPFLPNNTDSSDKCSIFRVQNDISHYYVKINILLYGDLFHTRWATVSLIFRSFSLLFYSCARD